MPNGLLVNDVEREQTVRKYLIKEAKNGQNSKSNDIKNKLCFNYLLNLYKSTVIERVTEFSPYNGDSISNISFDGHLNEFIQICEKVIEKTCSTLTSVKRVFNLSSQLSPSVSAVMKSLLKSFDEDENVPDHSSISKTVKKNKANKSPNSSKRSLRSENKQNGDSNNLKSPIPLLTADVLPSSNIVNSNFKVVLERLDDSIIHKIMGNKLSNINTVLEKDEIIQPIDLLSDNSSSEEENTRKLRSRKVLKIDDKVLYILYYILIKFIFKLIFKVLALSASCLHYH